MGRRPTAGPQFDTLELPVATRGVDLFVNPQRGTTRAKGTTLSTPLSTVDEAFDRLSTPKFFSAELANNARIHIVGSVFEQLVAPDDVHGVHIIGEVAGTPRFGTEGGVAVTDFAAYWTYPASGSTNAALLKLSARGWEIENMMFVPKNGYAAIELDEVSTYQGGNCFIHDCKLNGPNGIAGAQGYGIDAGGGGGFVRIARNQFFDLDSAIVDTQLSAQAHPLRWTIEDNVFESNKNDVYLNASRFLIRRNTFRTVYHATAHPNTLNLAAAADPATGNTVLDNFFADTSGNVTIAKGYKPTTGDVWCNHVAGTAAYIAAVPT